MHKIGIDIGGTGIAGGIVAPDGTIVARAEQPTPIKEGGKRILAVAIEVARSLIAAHGTKYSIGGIGVAAGGKINTVTGSVYFATDVIPGWKGIEIAQGFREALGLPCFAENDVNVLALAETRYGAARQYSTKGTIVFLALGTGVGGGLLIDGKLHHGACWGGGELGHIRLFPPTMPNVRKDLGGAKGTLEAYCSGLGLVHTWRELSGSTDSNITGEDVAKAAQADPHGLAAAAIRQTGQWLGCGLVTLADALDPNLIVIGGGLSELGDALLEPARLVLRAESLAADASCPVVPAKLGSEAAVVGAACLVAD